MYNNEDNNYGNNNSYNSQRAIRIQNIMEIQEATIRVLDIIQMQEVIIRIKDTARIQDIHLTTII